MNKEIAILERREAIKFCFKDSGDIYFDATIYGTGAELAIEIDGMDANGFRVGHRRRYVGGGLAGWGLNRIANLKTAAARWLDDEKAKRI
jgi:hypothetical protein